MDLACGFARTNPHDILLVFHMHMHMHMHMYMHMHMHMHMHDGLTLDQDVEGWSNSCLTLEQSEGHQISCQTVLPYSQSSVRSRALDLSLW